VLDRYWNAREFLEAHPHEEEKARGLYGGEEMDKHHGERKERYDDEYSAHTLLQ
jgi:hypothetical protein